MSIINIQQSSMTLIIETGVFSLSFLDHITKTRPSDKAMPFDSGEEESAVNDTHKIGRWLYSSARRTKSATKNLEWWRTEDPRLKKHFKPISRIEITNDVDKLDAIDSNLSLPRERHTEQSIAKLLDTQTLSAREHRCFEFAASLLKTANDLSLCCLWNEDNAVIDWNRCMDEIRAPLGLKIQKAKVNRLIVGDGGLVRGILLEGGKMVDVSKEDKVVMTVGAWTEALLKESGITIPLKRLRCVGVFTFYLKLNDLH
ncbi:hypothetical protein IFR05_016800 [Cadophora sp. M221]|nr:hypothetical protein IFR05_016800 [Cadophora sp. M221]